MRLLLALAVAALAAVPSTAGAVTVGLSDQQASPWGDARLRALGLRHARLVVPWDAATSDAARVETWLAAVAAAGMRPHVAFEHRRTDRCPASPCAAPTRAQYRAAVAAFRARFPQVTTFTTWNEANHVSQPVVSRPEVVAGYYDELKALCPTCTVVAGDVLDSGSYVRWLERFAAAAPGARLYGLHNYGDVTYGRTSGTDAALAAVPGELWLEETGGIVTLRNAAGRTTLTSSESRAASAIDRAFAIARARPRIGRMYVYHWKSGPLERFDSGLLRPDGSTRPSYAALVRNLTATTAAPAPRWRATWSKVKRNRLVLRVTCAATCAGRVRVVLRARRVALRRYRTSATRRTATLRITVSKTLRARVRRASRRRLVLRVSATLPQTGRRTVTVALPKPR